MDVLQHITWHLEVDDIWWRQQGNRATESLDVVYEHSWPQTGIIRAPKRRDLKLAAGFPVVCTGEGNMLMPGAVKKSQGAPF